MAATQHIAQFEHDCDHCRFLGHTDDVDHYYCNDWVTEETVLVQRRSSDDIDYCKVGIDDLFEEEHLLSNHITELMKRRWIVSLQLLALQPGFDDDQAMARRILQILRPAS